MKIKLLSIFTLHLDYLSRGEVDHASDQRYQEQRHLVRLESAMVFSMRSISSTLFSMTSLYPSLSWICQCYTRINMIKGKMIHVKLDEDTLINNYALYIIIYFIFSFLDHVYSTPLVTVDDVRRGNISGHQVVRITYFSANDFKRAAKQLGIMDDFKSGVPRMAYHGVVSFMRDRVRVYLAPNRNWQGYDPKWS